MQKVSRNVDFTPHIKNVFPTDLEIFFNGNLIFRLRMMIR